MAWSDYMPIMRSRYEVDVTAIRRSGDRMVVSVPMSVLLPHEKQAQHNHGQTLSGLRSRGGLSACEAVAILEDRQWRKMDPADSNRALLAAIANAAAVDGDAGWQPIGTAPKDGTNFIACSNCSSVFYAHWANGVVDTTSWTEEGGYSARHATHWMPLPPPPSAH